MKYTFARSGFSLIEVTLALGVAAFCLIAVMGMLPVALKVQQASVQQTKANSIISEIASDLRADVRLPPGQDTKAQGEWYNLHGRWANAAFPDVLYFTSDTKQTGSVNNPGTVPPDAVFRATITYMLPPTDGYTTSLADIKVTWPAKVDPATGVPAGSAETFIAVNR
jgi:type II secretory pathway component PulJ